jgi:hypothetical protein
MNIEDFAKEMRTVHMTDKELTIRQIGEFCTNTLCKKCPVAKWNEEAVCIMDAWRA